VGWEGKKHLYERRVPHISREVGFHLEGLFFTRWKTYAGVVWRPGELGGGIHARLISIVTFVRRQERKVKGFYPLLEPSTSLHITNVPKGENGSP
jgi:hypothetical protein